ncbi:MAG: acyl-CoA dehydrogenase family protein [Candidatus Alcyoniella australis]|nr:acyl-CoA dehydrogenase family protein [Candidatus Alcyoniella australis]
MIDFTPDETQLQIVETARKFGKEVLQPAEVELDAINDPQQAFDSKLFWDVLGQAFELGFPKMALPESCGGLELDASTTGMVWEELARWGTGITACLLAGSVVPQLINFLAPDNTELVERYVAPFCADNTGRKISAWASSEPDVGSDGKLYFEPKIRHYTTAVQRGDKWVINGTKSNFVSNGTIADVYIVFACVDPSQGLRGSGAFVVPADAPGVSRGKPVPRVGLRNLNQGPVFFEDVEIPQSYMIFPPGEGYPMLHNSIITVGNVGVGYLAVGLMRAAYEDALQYSKERVQGLKPIFEHQLIADKLFSAFCAIESSRALLWKASWMCRSSFPGDLKTSIAARVNATEQAVSHTAQMVRVLGGYGISSEYNLEKYARDALLLTIMDGTNETLMLKGASLL